MRRSLAALSTLSSDLRGTLAGVRKKLTGGQKALCDAPAGKRRASDAYFDARLPMQ
ncbi:MAG TPA: hypothetical protein VGB61_06485 [Pyrinomonadaceae bacterium]